jgi:transposase-like protein
MTTKLKKLELTPPTTHTHQHVFHPRVTNKTTIHFTNDELTLLNKGLKYNLPYRPKNWIQNLAIETETAISQLPVPEQDYTRALTAYNLKRLYTSHHTSNSTQHSTEYHTLKNIRTKLRRHNATVLKANQSNSVVILYLTDYFAKIQTFITENQFLTLHKDPTNSFQKQVKTAIKLCKSILLPHSEKSLIHMNPTAPCIRGLPKIHKPDCPVRPIINWRNAPAYKLARTLNSLLKFYIPLPNVFTIKNSVHLINELQAFPCTPSTKFASFDITNMYPNIPTDELIPIIQHMSTHNHLDTNITQHLLTLTSTILAQNYFTFQDTYYLQTTGLAMGAPTSALLSEIYLQYFEHTVLINALVRFNILQHYRYVDDIIVLYDDTTTDIFDVYDHINTLSPTLKFTLELETQHQLNFLDLTLRNQNGTINFNIYRKPVTTDIIIPATSSHPPAQKHAAIRYLTNRLRDYNLNTENTISEQHVIQQILTNNGYNISILNRLHHKKQTPDTTIQKTSWAKFTYYGKYTYHITKHLKKTPLRISLRANHTLGRQLTFNPHTAPRPQQTNYHKSGVYSLTCPTCHKKYVGQTGSSFQQRYREHFHDFKYNLKKSNFATHLLEHGHSIGPITDIMDILYTTQKRKFMDTIENYHIYRYTKLQTQINDRNTVKYNAIFDLICSHDPPPPFT